MSLKKAVPAVTVVICMKNGKEERLKDQMLKMDFPNSAEVEFILCGGNVKYALEQIESLEAFRPELQLHTDRFLPGGENLFERARGILTDYNVFYA